MKVKNDPDFPLTDTACQAATGKTMQEWFAELDGIDGLRAGRRECNRHMMGQKVDPWWLATITVEYEKHHGVKKKDGLFEGYTICVTKGISAPVDKVYATWTDPAKFAEMFGDGGTQDLKEGGTVSCSAGCKGTFSRIRPDKDLRFTWEHSGSTAPIVVDVMFQDNKGKTLMNVMSSRIQTKGEADGLRDSWGGFLVKLKSLSEA